MAPSLVLIGMPGAGKSTIGVLVAKYAVMDFVDTDVLIQVRTGESLQQTLDRAGYLELRRIEEQVILGLRHRQVVVATGGSAVYSSSAMAHLRALGRVVFLDVPLEILRQRLSDFPVRGIAGPPGQTVEQVHAERLPLYRRYADVTIACSGMEAEAIARRVAGQGSEAPGRASLRLMGQPLRR